MHLRLILEMNSVICIYCLTCRTKSEQIEIHFYNKNASLAYFMSDWNVILTHKKHVQVKVWPNMVFPVMDIHGLNFSDLDLHS